MKIADILYRSMLIFGVFLAALIIGCEQGSPLDVTQNSGMAVSRADHPSTPSDPIPIIDSVTARLMKLPDGSGAKARVFATKLVTADSGGTLSMAYSYTSSANRIVKRIITLQVLPDAVIQDVMITMVMDTSIVGVRFSPEGLVFKKPAILDFYAYGVDPKPKGGPKIPIVTSVQPIGSVPWPIDTVKNTKIQFFYDSEAGFIQWIPCNITESQFTGDVIMKGAQIPHFSRYGFGR